MVLPLSMTGKLRLNTPKGASLLKLQVSLLEIKVRISKTWTLMRVVLTRRNLSRKNLTDQDLMEAGSLATRSRDTIAKIATTTPTQNETTNTEYFYIFIELEWSPPNFCCFLGYRSYILTTSTST